MNRYPRETVEFAEVTVTDLESGESITTGVEVAVTTGSTRPVDWLAPVELDGKIGVMVDGWAPGRYWLWARVLASPETPVISCGVISVI